MTGMDAETGRALDGDAHLRQSVAIDLTTPLGTRAMLREFGAGIIEALGAPALAAAPEIYAAAAEALARWEPRLDVARLAVRDGEDGRLAVRVEGPHPGRRPLHGRRPGRSRAVTAPALIDQPSFEEVLAALRQAVLDRWPEWSATVESDPVQIVLEALAYRETVLRGDFRERMRRSYVQFATGDDLAALAEQHGVTIAEGESVESIRARIYDAPAAYAVAGPLAAYRHWARSVEGVDLAGVSSPAAGEIQVVCAARDPDTGDWAAAAAAAVAAVTALLSGEDLRPATDDVSVQAVAPLEVDVTAALTTDGATAGVLDAAEAALLAWLRTRPQAVGSDVPLSGIYAALTVEGVTAVALTLPAASVAVAVTQVAVPGVVTLTRA